MTKTVSAEIKNISLKFETDPSNFSPNGVDGGTLAMLSAVDFSAGDKVLDLGCGYGVVGILAAKLIGQENVVMCDISENAVKQAKINAALNGVPNTDIKISDGLRDVSESGFTLILSNPPYHADFSVPKRFIEDGFKKLAVGGKFVMVTKRLEWYKNKLTSVFGGVSVREINGYYVFISEKRGERVPKKEKAVGKLSKKLRRKQNDRNI
ncbi:MAG: methyltransferase [Ruminococcus sp.]|nr:methyltransferase [Ruminococcus sp.]MCM1380455.1 methyltransferase [Muribaculaceae bacterium]MCM1480083.1 methyltransferase [Muribaculaceae bacterium]